MNSARRTAAGAPGRSILLHAVTHRQAAGGYQFEQPGMQEGRDHRHAAPRQHQPRNHPIGAGLRRVDVDPQRVGDRHGRKHRNEQQPSVPPRDAGTRRPH